jgi:hypothetical protein
MPKLDEDDFVEPAGLPTIAQSKSGPPPAGVDTVSVSFSQSSPSTMASGSQYGGGTAPAIDRNQGGANAAQGADVLVAHDKDSQDWINKKWRPVMGWVYMMTCTADFVVFPVLWSVLQAVQGGQVTSQWNPITLQGAGLYHIAMGAVLGIAAYGRTKEKVEGRA